MNCQCGMTMICRSCAPLLWHLLRKHHLLQLLLVDNTCPMLCNVLMLLL
jgi:hypothetical protein